MYFCLEYAKAAIRKCTSQTVYSAELLSFTPHAIRAKKRCWEDSASGIQILNGLSNQLKQGKSQTLHLLPNTSQTGFVRFRFHLFKFTATGTQFKLA